MPVRPAKIAAFGMELGELQERPQLANVFYILEAEYFLDDRSRFRGT
jgi:hypothetical protein